MSDGQIIRKKYNLINAFRLIASFFVVAIHVHFPGTFGNIVIDTARFAVPFFFMASGFFSYYGPETDITKKIGNKIRNVLIPFCGAFVLYFAYHSLGGFTELVRKLVSPRVLLELFVFNETTISGHLWFLPALIYTYLVFLIFAKLKITQKVYFLIPVLFIAGVALKEVIYYLQPASDILREGYICRNFLFLGLPFFLLGHYIRANEEKLIAKFSNPVLITMIILGTVEAVLVGSLHAQKSVYIGSFVAVFALFVFVIKNEDKIKMPHLSSWGEKYSLYIYIIHIIIRDCVNIVGDRISFIGNICDKLTPVMPVLIFVASVIASAVYLFVKTKAVKLISGKKGKSKE